MSDIDYSETILRLGAEPLQIDRLAAYDQWSLHQFRREDYILDPHNAITIEWDVTDAEQGYERVRHEAEASFFAYLMWTLVRAIHRQPPLNYRYLAGTWYAVDDPPVFVPIAIGGEQRYGRLYIERPASKTWPEFAAAFRQQLREVAKKDGPITVAESDFQIALVISDLPMFRFTSLRFHRWKETTGRQAFYFGQRFDRDGRLWMPFHATVDHANADALRMQTLLEDWQALHST